VSDRISAVEAYKSALVTADDSVREAAAGVLTDEVVILTNFGVAEGKDAAVELLKNPRTSGFLAGASWSEPVEDGDRLTTTATLAPTMPIGGLEFVFEFAGDHIARVEQQMIPGAPLEAKPLHLTDDIKAAVDGALDNQTPMLAAYRDDLQIHLSFRGTVQAYSDDQLAMWARDPNAGMPRNIAVHPEVTVFYNDPATFTSYTFYGRAYVVTDQATRDIIFDNSNPREQNMDFRRPHAAIMVDLDKVEGRGGGGRILMERR
jgi:hypothetical protein